MIQKILTRAVCAVFAVSLIYGLCTVSIGGEAQLKNGMILDGHPVPIQGLTKTLVRQSQGPTNVYPILLVETDMRRYFVPARQVEDVQRAADLSRYEKFELPQKRSSGQVMVQSLGRFDATPFDEFGRRRVTVSTSRGPLHIVQGVTEITPQSLTVKGLTHAWEHGLATTSLPAGSLDQMIRTATDQTNPDDRLAIARFYIQAGMYPRGAAELESIVGDFPELEERADEVGLQLRQLQAQQLLGELRRRREAGQHYLAYAATQNFPVKDVSAAVLREVRELTTEYDEARERAERALSLLGELQSELEDSEQVSAAAPLRSVVSEQLNYESLDRLDAFLNLEGDDSLTPAEKLALAYSGWLLGSGNAITDFNETVQLWEARYLILAYLRAEDPRQRNDLLAEILNVEGIAPERLVQMVPLLPPLIETPEIQPGQKYRVEVTPEDAEVPVAYSVLLPEEYNPHHRYPLVVALHPAGRQADDELVWWGMSGADDERMPGQSQRHGYIVIAPEYADKDQRDYDYGISAHYVVLKSLRDARKRFSIDSDRVFLSGHGMGGDAAFDIGMSHPDVFAGVMPIAGISDKYCKWYWSNSQSLPWYVVGGELDRDSRERNARELNRMMRHGYDVIYAEYIGRGYESYYEEIHRLFDWMKLHRRVRHVQEIDMKVLRPSENRFYWITLDDFPSNVTRSTVLADEGNRQRTVPMSLTAKVTPGNSVHVRSGAGRHTLWLSPDVIDFEKRVAVRVNGRQRFNDFLRPSIEAMLEDLRIRGDRQKLAWVKLDLD